MVRTDAVGVEKAERMDLRQTGHFLLEQDVKVLAFQLLRAVLGRSERAGPFGHAGQHQIGRLQGAFDQLRQTEALAQQVVLHFAQRAVMQLHQDECVGADDGGDGKRGADGQPAQSMRQRFFVG